MKVEDPKKLEKEKAKRPAHEVIVVMIKETIKAITKNQNPDELLLAVQLGILSAELQMLKRMVIPEKNRQEVVNSLLEVRANCPLESILKVWPEVDIHALL